MPKTTKPRQSQINYLVVFSLRANKNGSSEYNPGFSFSNITLILTKQGISID